MASSSDGIPVLPPMPDFTAQSSPFSSAGDMKFYLQNLLDNKERQLQQAGTLGQRVLAQQMELEERIRQLQDIDADKSDEDEIDDQARERYRELADTLIAWDSENAQLSSVFGGSKRLTNGKTPSPSIPFAQLPREEPERPKPSAGTSAAQSRRAKNAAHRADDVEFAFEIGSGLLTEVRRLQSLLGERDKAIQDMKEEKDDLEKSVEALRAALRQQEQSSDKYKEENWNLEVTLQELRTQLSDSQFAIQRLEGEHKVLADALATSRDTGDQYKNENERLSNQVEEMKSKHETSIAQARRHAAGLAREKSDLQQAVDSLKNEIAKAGRRLPRFGSPLTPNGAAGGDFLHTPAGEPGDGDVFTGGASTNRRRLDTSAMFGADGEILDLDSPDVSPVRPPFLAANHPTNEMEALQQRLAHAQRQISTLKGTVQREKQLRMEYRAKLQTMIGGSDMAGEIDNEDDEDDGDDDDGIIQDGKRSKPRKVTPFKVGGRGRGRGRGRGTTFTQRLGMAAASPSSEFNDDDGPPLDDSPVPPVPPIPIRFSQPQEDEDSIFSVRDLQMNQVQPEEEEEQREHSPSRSPSPMEPNSNRASIASIASATSVEGMDPAFANILRRVPSNGSSYAGSPLRQAVLTGSARGRGAGRRSRGGVPYKEARPPSLVDVPGALSAELLGMEGSPMKSQEILEEVEEAYHAPEMAEFGCQTEPEEPQAVVVPDTAEIAIQAEPLTTTSDYSMQTDQEPEPFTPVHVEMSVGTEPEPEPVPAPILVAAETQTIQANTADADTQTALTPAKPEMRDLGVGWSPSSGEPRRTTITQYDRSFGSLSGDTTITRPFLAEDGESDDDGDQTETGADTETDADDYQDARQSLMTPSATESREDFHSLMTMSDNEFSDSEDDAESIKASRMTPSQQGHSIPPSIVGTSRRPSSYFAAVSAPPIYEDVGVSADFKPEPERVIVEVEVPAPVPPKPEVKEISIQTDEWRPPAPLAPIMAPVPSPAYPPTPSSNPTLYRVGSSSSQQFQFIAPPPPASAPSTSVPPSPLTSAPIPVAIPGPLSNLLRESSGTFARSRTPASDRRQSMESVISSTADDLTSRSRAPSGATMLTVVDKSKPPMMILPPPPKLPPPPGSMAPPSFIPEKRIPTSSSGSYDVPPPRPSSPPPPELIQRATTPTFGSVLSVPGRGTLRQHGSMPPSQTGLRQLPSTSSFRSAANAVAHAQLSTPPSATLSSLSVRERERRQFSQTSLISERSAASPRSSISSDHFRNPITPEKAANITPRAVTSYTTDPAIIHAITQTMIGEFLYKYTRRTIGKGHGQSRHKRFFWVHPYTRTLYWSSADPGSTNVSESSAKSAYIEGVRAVLDPNPMPPGLHQYSVIVATPQREMKFTAPTKERHDIWLNALQYLLSRPSNPNIASPGNATVVPQSPISQDGTDEDRLLQNASSPQSQRSYRSTRNGDTWNTTPRGQRSRSQVSVKGSIGKRGGTPAAEYLRWNGPESPYSPTKSFVDVPHHDEDDLDFELHAEGMSDDGFEGLENVRACCDGKHTVGHSHHHHHHHNGDHLEPIKKDPVPARPVSPAWSFRSRTGSAHSNEGGGRGLFSWAKGDDQKLRFGSRRTQKTVPVNE